MKLVSKNVISRFSNQTYSMQSMMEVFGRQPHHIAGYIRHKKQYSMGLMAITEMLGNIYADSNMSQMKLDGIEAYSFTYDVDVSQIPTLRFTRTCTSDGSGFLEFEIYLNDKFFSKYDIIALRNTQQLYVMEEPIKVSPDEYKYIVRLIAQKPSESVDIAYMVQNETARYVSNAHPEFSEYGTNKSWYNTERHIEHMTKIRAGQPYSSDFKATESLYFMTDKDIEKATVERGGRYKVFRLDSIEQQVLDHFFTSANTQLLLGRTNIDETTGRPTIQLANNQDVIIGNGLIAQYEKYAHYIDYTNLHVRDFQDAIENIAEKRGQSQGNHITVLCNRIFSRQKAKALQDQIGIIAPYNNGAWFFSKDFKPGEDGVTKHKVAKKILANDITVGATFSTYIYEGNTITFIVDEALTNHYQDRGYAIFIDTGVYEDEKGKTPAVHLKTLKGRELVKNHITGMGGINGSTSGVVSQSLDASRFEVLGWRGVCVRNPYAATILEENV